MEGLVGRRGSCSLRGSSSLRDAIYRATLERVGENPLRMLLYIMANDYGMAVLMELIKWVFRPAWIFHRSRSAYGSWLSVRRPGVSLRRWLWILWKICAGSGIPLHCAVIVPVGSCVRLGPCFQLYSKWTDHRWSEYEETNICLEAVCD